MRNIQACKIIFLLLFGIGLAGAQENTWRTLNRVQIKKEFNAEFGIETIIPTFTPEIKALEGKQIQVGGYIIPVTGKRDQSHLMFSMYPNSTCFFCGKAGPETAMQVFMAGNKKVRYTEDKVYLKGKLQLAEDDPSGLIYTLTDAQLISQ